MLSRQPVVFDSVEYVLFYPLVLVAYHLVSDRRRQNQLLLLASLYFYGSWDWRFLPLLGLSAMVDYLAGLSMAATQDPRLRARWLSASVAVNLGILGTFKYLGFFVESAALLLGRLGLEVHPVTLEIVLPVGISFYTFQSMSYSIDIFRGKAEPERDFLTFLTYVAFFPQLVAGPIERASHLLPQFRRARVVDEGRLKEGVWNIAWGLFLKVVISDTMARYADLAFDREVNGATFFVGTLAFGLQIYCDFNGYSLIARGCASLLGFDLRWNFARPYFASSMREFWRRWHISLSSWLKDYLYIPLGGNRRGPRRTTINLMLTMLLGGLWHGAAWNFVLWGGLHGLALAIERQLPHRERVPWLLGWATTMLVVFVGWTLFRANTPWLLAVVLMSTTQIDWTPAHTTTLASVLCSSLPVLAVDLWGARVGSFAPGAELRGAAYPLLVGTLLFSVWAMFGRYDAPFVYFQF